MSRNWKDAGIDRKHAEAHLEATRAALDPLTANSINKLDSTDFENIYLQVRNRGWKWFLGIASALGVGTAIGTWQLMDNYASKGVDAYIKTERFQHGVMNAAMSRLDSLDIRTEKAEKALSENEKRAGVLGNLPLAVRDHGFVLTDREGRNFQFETGTAHSGQIILFKFAFKSRPKIFIQDKTKTVRDRFEELSDRRQLQADRMLGVRRDLFQPIGDGRTGFSVRNDSFSREYDWIAIGE
jgi:hypothetical protein